MVKIKAQTITPLKVTGINNKANDADVRKRNWLKALVLMFALVMIIGGGGALLHFLSKNPYKAHEIVESTPESQLKSQQKQTAIPGRPSSDPGNAEAAIKPVLDNEKKQAQAPAEHPPETPDPASLAAEKKVAEEKLAQYIELKNELDRQGAPHWGMEAYQRMSEVANQADTLLMDQKYQASAEKYSEAIAGGGQLAARADEVYNQLLHDGHQALQVGNGTLAQDKFSVALMIEPDSQTARRGLQRAKTIETVTQLISSGKAHELDNQLSLAHKDYQKALELDPDSKAARESSNRVKDKIKAQQFQQLISDGLNAYHKNELQLARSKLIKAKKLRPNSREVQDALAQVDAAMRLSKIEQFKKKGSRC